MKIILLTLLLLPVFSKAQSIVGSWHLTDMKGVVTDKATGQKQNMDGEEMKEMKSMLDYRCVFNANHTMTWTARIFSGKPFELKGTYVFEGDKLSTHLDISEKFKVAQGSTPMGNYPTYVTISFSDGKMIWHYAIDTKEEKLTLHSDMEWIWDRQ